MSSLVLNTKKFVPSEQQAAFFSWITDESGSCVLEAVAGVRERKSAAQIKANLDRPELKEIRSIAQKLAHRRRREERERLEHLKEDN